MLQQRWSWVEGRDVITEPSTAGRVQGSSRLFGPGRYRSRLFTAAQTGGIKALRAAELMFQDKSKYSKTSNAFESVALFVPAKYKMEVLRVSKVHFWIVAQGSGFNPLIPLLEAVQRPLVSVELQVRVHGVQNRSRSRSKRAEVELGALIIHDTFKSPLKRPVCRRGGVRVRVL